MKILMQNRIDTFKNSGGDTIQMLKTKEYLEKLGIDVDISLELEPDLSKYDIIHLFNITRVHETYLQYLNARKQDKPIVLSSIYQNFDELDCKASSGTKGFILRNMKKEYRERFKTGVRAIIDPSQFRAARKQLFRGFINQQREIISGVDIILPNTELEANAMKEDFGLNFDYEIVPNAVDLIFAQKNESFVQQTGLYNYILCVGNYIERKNQLSLIEAMEGTDIPLVFVGAIVKTHMNYYKKIDKAAKSKKGLVTLMDKVTQDNLIPIYSGAKVVVLPSWIETTGLACLEGALTGCNIVITNRGYAVEYFKNLAFYCDPSDTHSIKAAILRAYNSPANPDLKQYITANFTWEKAAEATLKAYKNVLERKHERY